MSVHIHGEFEVHEQTGDVLCGLCGEIVEVPPTDEHHVEIRSEAEAIERRKYQRRAADRSGGLLAACKTTLSFLRSVRVSDSSDPLQAIQDRVHGPVRRRLEEAIAAAERLEPQPDPEADAARVIDAEWAEQKRRTYTVSDVAIMPDRLDAVRERLQKIKDYTFIVFHSDDSIIARTVEEIEELLDAK